MKLNSDTTTSLKITYRISCQGLVSFYKTLKTLLFCTYLSVLKDYNWFYFKFGRRRGLVVDTWLRDQEVPGSSPGSARSTLSLWERLFTCICSSHSCVKRVPDSFVTLPTELTKVQWLEWLVGDPL